MDPEPFDEWDGTYRDVFSAVRPRVDTKTNAALGIISKRHGLRIPRLFSPAFVYGPGKSLFPDSYSHDSQFSRPLPSNLDARTVESFRWGFVDLAKDLNIGLFPRMTELYADFVTNFGSTTPDFARLLVELSKRAGKLEVLSLVCAETHEVHSYPEIPIAFSAPFRALRSLRITEPVLEYIINNAPGTQAIFPVLEHLDIWVRCDAVNRAQYRGQLLLAVPRLVQLTVVYVDDFGPATFFKETHLPTTLRSIAINTAALTSMDDPAACVSKLEESGGSERIECFSLWGLNGLDHDKTPQLTRAKWLALKKLRLGVHDGSFDLVSHWPTQCVPVVTLLHVPSYDLIEVEQFMPMARLAKEAIIVRYHVYEMHTHEAMRRAGLDSSKESTQERGRRLLQEATGMDVVLCEEGDRYDTFPYNFYLAPE